MAQSPPFLPALHDTSSPLRHTNDLLEAAEPDVLATVDASVEQHGPFGLYGIAWQLGSAVVRKTHTLLAWVALSPHPEVHELLYRFLSALLSETRGNMGVAWSAEVFRSVREWTARKMVCSLLWLQRAIRHALPLEFAS